MDVDLQHLITDLQHSKKHSHFSWDGVLLKRRSKLVVGNNVQLRMDILQQCHASALGSHSGKHATYQRMKSMFYWKGREFIRHCAVCQQTKYETVAYPGLLQPLPIPQYVFADLSMDFIYGLPKSKGKDVVFVVMDRLTKYAHFMPLV